VSPAATRLAAASAFALGLAVGSSANAAVVSFTPNAALTSSPLAVSLGGAPPQYAFTAVSTGNGPGAAVSTRGTATVSSFFGGVTDFAAGSAIDQNGQLYGFSAFPAPATIPFSAADDYIGLAFTLADGLHYGYAEVSGSRLVSYAFDSTPNTSIVTGAIAAVPEPASLLLLAGMAGVAMTKRRNRVQDSPA
jgi:hypothetical protein